MLSRSRKKEVARIDKQKDKCINCFVVGVEVHHPLIYSGKKIEEVFVPLCTECHRGDNGTIWQNVREYSEMIAIEQNLDYLKRKYPRLDWEQKLNYLIKQNDKLKGV